jgi:hypothetical protein
VPVRSSTLPRRPAQRRLRPAYTVRGLPFTARSRGGGREAGEPARVRTPGRPLVPLRPACRRRPGGRHRGQRPRYGAGGLHRLLAAGPTSGGVQQRRRGSARLTVPARAGTAYWFQATKTLTQGELSSAWTCAAGPRWSRHRRRARGRGESSSPKISADGRYVVFHSRAGPRARHAGACVSPPRPIRRPKGRVTLHRASRSLQETSTDATCSRAPRARLHARRHRGGGR